MKIKKSVCLKINSQVYPFLLQIYSESNQLILEKQIVRQEKIKFYCCCSKIKLIANFTNQKNFKQILLNQNCCQNIQVNFVFLNSLPMTINNFTLIDEYYGTPIRDAILLFNEIIV